jgi:integrase
MSRQILGARMRQIHNVLNGSLDQAVRWKWCSDNPARWATLPPQRQADVRPPTPEDVLAVIEVANQDLAAFLRIAAAVGGRRGEVAALRWPAVNLDASELVIPSSLVESSARQIYENDTKTHQSRRLAIDDGTVLARKSGALKLKPASKQLVPMCCRTDSFSVPRWTVPHRGVRSTGRAPGDAYGQKQASITLFDFTTSDTSLRRLVGVLSRGLDGPPRHRYWHPIECCTRSMVQHARGVGRRLRRVGPEFRSCKY